jgi:hypothetical protein
MSNDAVVTSSDLPELPTLTERKLVSLDTVLDSIQQRFFQIRVGGKVFVGDREANDILEALMPVDSFKTFFRTEKVEGKDPLEIWLKSAQRVRLVGFTFDPSGDYGDLRNVFNLYHGPAFDPVVGECQIILDHIHEVLCGGSQEQSKHFLDWLAHMYQRPWEHTDTSIILQSGEGTGKSIIMRMLREMWGQHSIQIDSESQITGNHNDHLARKMLICTEEFTMRGKIAATDYLKNLVSSPTMQINPKGKASFQINSFARLMCATNHPWALQASKESRRWFVPTISAHRVGDFSYFSKLAAVALSKEGQRAFLHFLLERDISNFDPHKRPDTTALEQQKRQTMDKLELPLAWLTRVLESGEFERVKVGGSYTCFAWNGNAPTPCSSVRESYELFVDKKRNPPRWDSVAKRLREIWPTLKKTRKRVGGTQVTHYLLPNIEEARALFEGYAGITLDALPEDCWQCDQPVIPQGKRVVDVHEQIQIH